LSRTCTSRPFVPAHNPVGHRHRHSPRGVLGGAQREHQGDREPVRGGAPQAVFAAFEAGERGVGEVVFVQELDAQAGRGQRVDNAADVVVPLDEGVGTSLLMKVLALVSAGPV
jgi:hypothetical protein